MKTATIYQRILAAGIEHDHHESDLYVPDTPEVRRIIEECRHHTQQVHAIAFINNLSPGKGDPWLDIPFAYDPWWNAQLNRVVTTH